jgi:hypothetical protein
MVAGDHGKKYRYKPNEPKSKEIARKKAAKQGRAIKASQAAHMHGAGVVGGGGGDNDYYALYLKYRQRYLDSK